MSIITLPRAFMLVLLVLCGPADAAPSPDLVRETCGRIARKLASVGLRECLARGLQASGALSVQGTPILVREFSPIAGRRPLARVLVVGGIHGDEYASVSIVFKWLRILQRHHSGRFHWRVAPLMNPDGLLRRKSQRVNAKGVDLNRNFPTPDWHAESARYWQRTGRNPRRYPGPTSLSEPESRWLASEIRGFRPDAILAIHAPYGIVDFDGPPLAPKRLGGLYLKLLGIYPGSLGNYAGVQGQIPVVTVELPHAGIMPKPREVRRIWSDAVNWLFKRFPDRALQRTARVP